VYEGILEFDAMVSIFLSLLFERELRVSTAFHSELMSLPHPYHPPMLLLHAPVL